MFDRVCLNRIILFAAVLAPAFSFPEGYAFAHPHELYLSTPEPDIPLPHSAEMPPKAFPLQKNAQNMRLQRPDTALPSASSLLSPKSASPYIISINAADAPKSPIHYSTAGIPDEKPSYNYERFAGSSGLPAATKEKWEKKKGWVNKTLYSLDKFFNQPVPEQWSSGTLYELFAPAEKPGEWTIEPYFVATVPNGDFDNLGRQVSNGPGAYSFAQQWYLQAGVTDRLSVNIMPGYVYNWGGGERSGSVEAQDLPFDLQYRVTPDNQFPLVTVYLGGQAPTGPYDQLQNANNGTGTGAWSFNFGASATMNFPFFGHALIADVWGQANQTTGDVRVKGMSTYGTDENFNGWAVPSQFGSAGLGLEFGVTKKFMLDLELIGYWNAPVRMKGWEAGEWQEYEGSGWTDVFDVGPGLEYSFNEHWSVVSEVIIPVAGVNSSASLSPSAAIVCSY